MLISFIVLIFLLGIISSFVQRSLGFGFGIVIMTALPHLMPSYEEATALAGILAMVTSARVVFAMRQYICWKRLIPILVIAMTFAVTSIIMLRNIDDSILRKVLGCVLIFISLYFAFLRNRISIRPTKTAQLITGTLSGLMGGLFSMQGPPIVLYLLASEKDKEHYMAMIQAYFLLGNAVMTTARGCNGFITPMVGFGFLVGLGGVIIGAFIGKKVFERIPVAAFRIVVYCYIALSGILVML